MDCSSFHFPIVQDVLGGDGLVTKLCPTLVTPWTVAHQAPLSMEFSRQEYWSGLPCPPPGDLPDPGMNLFLLSLPALAGGFFTTSAIWEACLLARLCKN